ncbi:helix-hairpin-helix domain-containing protein [uncultured Limosilactobacillus sp.]|uniref:helix-hairpin-helix domain-containing protein n=1 Tax=uncultured Limosilactobacillus sp. TaxID=2837629 RepID=UPI0025F25B61|nr:helix-hairpin-helix domain-containing protein [uncultured Limosilactobacillus sp.]
MIDKIKEFCWLHLRFVSISIGLVVILTWLSCIHFSRIQHQPTDRLPVNQRLTKATAVTTTRGGNSSKVCVDIKGAVNRPGVYHLVKGSRVEEAIAAAGGSTSQADLNQVNLAKELLDQQVIQIPKVGEQVTQMMGPMTDGNRAVEGSKVNLNTAGKDELTKIDGIGDKKAEKILEYRNQHGGFKTPADLKNIAGFGEKTVAKLKDQLAV